ncbi:MAG TPA: hypothetical protein VNA32_05675 [Actinomycetota bacterium]|nr:hypothetical protein [Actinomycetota bacterium]
MIKFGGQTIVKATGQPGRLIGIGLSAENARRLVGGEPIVFNLGEVHPDLADCEVVIIGGETEADIKGLLAPLLGPGTTEKYPWKVPLEGEFMNTETGRIYREQEEIEAARKRGEPVVEVSERVAELMELAHKVEDQRATHPEVPPRKIDPHGHRR